MKTMIQNFFGRSLMVFAVLALMALVSSVAMATGTDPLADAVTTIGGYWTAVLAIAVPVVLFVVGRRIVKKI